MWPGPSSDPAPVISPPWCCLLTVGSSHPHLPPYRPCCSKSDDFHTFGSIFLEKGFEREVRALGGPREGAPRPGRHRVQAVGSCTPRYVQGGGGESLQLADGGGDRGSTCGLAPVPHVPPLTPFKCHQGKPSTQY